VFEAAANSKICCHVVRPDRNLSLFYSLPQGECSGRSPTGGFCTYSYLSSKNCFSLAIKLWPQSPEHALYNTANSHINRGIKCKEYLIICKYYNFLVSKNSIYFCIYQSIIFIAQFDPLYVLHRIIFSSPSTVKVPIY